MRDYWDRFLNIGALPTDSEDERLRKRILIVSGTMLPFSGLVWGTMYLALGVPRAALIPGGYGVLSFCGLLYFALTKRYEFFRASQLFLVLLLPPVLQLALGGFVASSAVIMWAVLSPMGALMFSGRTQALYWFCAFLVLAGGTVLLGPEVPETTAEIPPFFRTVLFLMNIGGCLTCLFIAMQYFERGRDAALSETRLKNTELTAGIRKLEELNATKDQLFTKISGLSEHVLPHLGETLGKLQQTVGESARIPMQGALHEVRDVMKGLKPLTIRYSSEQAMRSKRLLLAESDKRRQVIAKMALAGTGVILDIVSDMAEGRQKINTTAYDILCVDSKLMELAPPALDKSPKLKTVFMVADGIQSHLGELQARPFLSNVVCSDEHDRVFTVKNITTTISKLVTQELFGLEKYLGWGVEVNELPVRQSVARGKAIDQMETYLRECGLSGSITRRAVTVAEELLSNAIYDAPVDAQGKPLYNHLPRTEPVELTLEQEALLRYACDGILVGISVTDPFGALSRQTILDYLVSCYEGRPGTLNANKGGAGRGLFQIMESSSLVVFNVRERFRTEVCAFFNVDIQLSKRMNERSFHFFYE